MTATQYYNKLIRDLQVELPVIEEAKEYRVKVARAALAVLESLGLRGLIWYPTGALAMGTQNHPLHDFDLVVEANAILPHWSARPAAALEELCSGLQFRLRWPCETSDHAVKIKIPGVGYTADVVFGSTRPQGGIDLPHCPNDEPHRWIASNPRTHAQLVRDRNRRIGVEFAREVRIIKHLNRMWGMRAPDERKPLSSWHVTALGWWILDAPFNHAEGTPWFLERAAELVRQPLPDPSNVGPAIEARDPHLAATKLATAAAECRRALSMGDRADQILRPVFGDAGVLRAAVSGQPVAVGAGGEFVRGGSGRPVPSVRNHGDPR
jgi:hypothetical protein